MNKIIKIIQHRFHQIPEAERRITVATMFTLARIIATPFIVFFIAMHWWYSACVLFLLAGATDVIDGFLARHYNQKTLLGAALDPVADKILLFCVFLSLFFVKINNVYIPGWFVALLFAKELLQIVGGFFLYIYHSPIVIEAHLFGKITTFVQIIFIIWVFGSSVFNKNIDSTIYMACLTLISFLMIMSFLWYSYAWLIKVKLSTLLKKLRRISKD